MSEPTARLLGDLEVVLHRGRQFPRVFRYRPFSLRPHDQELGSSRGATFEREVDEVGFRVDRDRVRLGGEEGLPELLDSPSPLGEYGDDAAFGSDVEAVQRAVESEHVGVVADGRAAGELHPRQVEREQHRVAVAGHERDAARRIDEQAVVVVAAGDADAADDPVCARVDDRDVVPRLDVE